MASCRVKVGGAVQGVFFRASAKAEADRLGLRGWIKNTSNGEVLVTATGNLVQLDLFIDWCRLGPPHARVEAIEIEYISEQAFEDFSILR